MSNGPQVNMNSIFFRDKEERLKEEDACSVDDSVIKSIWKDVFVIEKEPMSFNNDFHDDFEVFWGYCRVHGVIVPRETLKKIMIYVQTLVVWQQKMNLISKNSCSFIWTRHVLDSFSLLPFLPEGAKTFFDFGSGAGFPGIIVTIMTGLYGHYIESNQKKSMFLNEVVRTLRLDGTVLCHRIENIIPFCSNGDKKEGDHRDSLKKKNSFKKRNKNDVVVSKPDIIISRAMASLRSLLDYCEPFQKSGQTYLFLKGKSLYDEIDQCSSFPGEYEVYPSIGNHGYIFKLTVS